MVLIYFNTKYIIKMFLFMFHVITLMTINFKIFFLKKKQMLFFWSYLTLLRILKIEKYKKIISKSECLKKYLS